MNYQIRIEVTDPRTKRILLSVGTIKTITAAQMLLNRLARVINHV